MNMQRLQRVLDFLTITALVLALAIAIHGQVQNTTTGRVYYTATKTVASGTIVLSTGAISSGTCTSAQTGSATGTLTTDNLMVDFNADPTGTTGYAPVTTGMLTIIKYPTADTANVKICNLTTGSITPGATTLNFRVTR